MRQPDDQVLRAIYSLQGNESWKTFLTWIEDSIITQALILSPITDGTEMRLKQGRIQELVELKKHIDGAGDKLQEIQKRNEPEPPKIF